MAESSSGHRLYLLTGVDSLVPRPGGAVVPMRHARKTWRNPNPGTGSLADTDLITPPGAVYNPAQAWRGPFSPAGRIGAAPQPRLFADRSSRTGSTMPPPNKRPTPSADEAFPPGSVLAFLADRNQVDFELDFYTRVLAGAPEFHEVLRAQASNMTTRGRLQEGLAVDKKLVAIRPEDPTAHYNLACRYALLKQADLALVTLRAAIELGYRDFRYMEEDHDLDSIRKDPRFRAILREYRRKKA